MNRFDGYGCPEYMKFLRLLRHVTDHRVIVRMDDAWKIIDDILYTTDRLGAGRWAIWADHITSIDQLNAFTVITCNISESKLIMVLLDTNKNCGNER